MQETKKKQIILIFNDKEYKLEIESNITIKSLSKLAKNMLNLDKNSFKLLCDDKDLLIAESVKLNEIFLDNKEIKIKVSVSNQRNLCSRSKSEFRLKYMLECSLHTNENAHYYCFSCKKSFCTICSTDHTSHDVIDKYNYCKTSDELLHSVMDDIVVFINQYEEEIKSNEKQGNSFNSIDSQFKEIIDLSKLVSEQYNSNLNEKSLTKINNFKKDFFYFKTSCLSALNETKAKKISDLIILEDDYFLNLHQTIKNFNISKVKLIDYLKQIKKEFNDDKSQINEFEAELSQDINAIIEKMKNKLKVLSINNNTKSEKNILKSQVSTLISDNISINVTRSIIKRRIGKSEVIVYDFLSKAFEKKKLRSGNIENYSALVSERGFTNLDRNSQFSDLASQYSQVSQVKSTNNLNIETQDRVLNRKRSSVVNIEKFLQFSVYLNVDNNLYISGGKKNEECVKDFLFYSLDKNTLVKLESMKIARCSHAMAYVAPNDIYVVGGYCNNTTEKYCINEKMWKPLKNLNFKERQVPTLILINNRYLYCLLGYIITNINDTNDYVERFDTFNIFSSWELLKINNPNKIDLKIFNAGCIINSNEIIICGGEKYAGNETDQCFTFNVSNLEFSKSDIILPQPSSFLEKIFISFGKGKYFQFEMKKNNLFIFNISKKKFKIKTFN